MGTKIGDKNAVFGERVKWILERQKEEEEVGEMVGGSV